MREKICDFIYLDTERYISLKSLKIFYWGTFIIPFYVAVMSMVAINLNGVNWKSLFPLASIVIWSMLYWGFVIAIQNKRIKKSFELRFLVNGVAGLLMSALVWVFFASFNLIADKPILDFDICLWMIPLYVLISLLFITIIIIGVHKGVYGKIRQKGKTKKALAISAFFACLIPFAGVCGKLTARLLREHASLEILSIVGTTSFIVLIFVPVLAHINFVQYFYCKKYNINCDENGDTTSQKLILETSDGNNKPKKRQKKKMNIFLKILLILFCIPVAFFTILFIIGFIKAIVEKI